MKEVNRKKGKEEQKMNIIQNKDIAWQVYDGEAVLVDSKDGVCRVLNDTATVIWNACSEPASLSEVVDAVCSEFEAERSEVEKDVEETVRDFLEKKLLKEV